MAAIKVESLHNPVILSCDQAPKQTSSELLFDEIKMLSNKYRYDPIWICGKFYLLDIISKTKPSFGSQHPKFLNKSFLETFEPCNSNHLVNSATKKNHTLDLLTRNSLKFLEKCLPIPGFGDHDTAILVDVANQPKYYKPHIGKFSC